MFAVPPTTWSQPFAILPENLRVRDKESAWSSRQPGRHAQHSLLEGPAFDHRGVLHCVDVLWGRIFQVDHHGDFKTVAQYDGEPNGLAIHRDGRIFIADYRRGIMVLEPDSGRVTPLVEHVDIQRFKGVNDLTFASNGDLYFTDQGLTGLHDPTGRVFRYRPDGRIDCLLDNVPSPNGLVLDPLGEVLYIAATRANAVWRVPLLKDGSTAKVGTFVQLSGGIGPDGLAMDSGGRLAVAHHGLGTVWIFDAYGEPALRIRCAAGPGVTNVAYGADECTLFITEASSGAIHVASPR